MSQDNRNIYQAARNTAGLTQERAAEAIFISVESIRAYEGGARIPPDDVVTRMVDIYGTTYLANQHLREKSELARRIVPKIELKDLPTAILCVHKEVTDFLKLRDELIEIGSDGIITADEQPRFDEIIKQLDDIVAAVQAIKCAKKPLRGG
jgi:transcriptional regulator with XRE-family HTH domain